jgi:hypothetical protein
MDTFGPGEGAYATAALFIALARKLIDKEIISKEEMSGIVDEAGVLLSRAPAGVMGQARTNLLPKFRKYLGIEDQSR